MFPGYKLNQPYTEGQAPMVEEGLCRCLCLVVYCYTGKTNNCDAATICGGIQIESVLHGRSSPHGGGRPVPLSVLDLQLVTTLDGRLHVAASRNGGGCHTVRRSQLYVWIFRTTAACINRLQSYRTHCGIQIVQQQQQQAATGCNLAARTAGYEIVQQHQAANLPRAQNKGALRLY